jgi:microcystin-dependent protein
MSLQFTITNAGRAALVNAANTGSAPITITEIALGSAYAAATTSRTSLTTEIKRIPALGGGTVADDIIHVTGKDTSSDSYSVKELGLYTDAGVLFAICAESTAFITKGSGTFAVIAADLKITGLPADSVTVGDVTLANPPATETVKGVAELATQAETNTDTDDERIVTPKKLAARTATDTRTGIVELATNAETQTGTDASRAVTPAGLASVTATTARRGLVELATDAEAAAGNSTEHALTPSHLQILAGEFFKMLYPIGEMLITQREGNPNTWLGFGTWQRFGAGRTIVGYDAADADFNTLGKTGGAKTITLSVGEIPGHTHTVGPLSTTTGNSGAHRHLLERTGNTRFVEGQGTGPSSVGGNFEMDGAGTRPAVQTTESGAHTHTVTIDQTLSGSTGGGGAHSNVQPYITVYMWKRIS